MRRNRQLVAALLLLWASGAWAEALSMGVRGYLVQQEVFSLFAEPGEEIRLELASYDTDKLQLQLDGQAYGVAGEGYWVLTAPERAGLYQLQLEHGESGRIGQHRRGRSCACESAVIRV